MNNRLLSKQTGSIAGKQIDKHTGRQIDKQTNKQTGKHIVAELWGCQCAPELLNRSQPLLGLLIEAVSNAQLTLVGQMVHEFEAFQEGQDVINSVDIQFVSDNDSKGDVSKNMQTLNDGLISSENRVNEDVQVAQSGGVTLSLLLAESHLCIHTWGEYQTVTLDVYVCNVANNNSDKAEALFSACLALFQPKSHHVDTLYRVHGVPNNL